ncbi:hypothetical protein BH09MYX1_BH09MYX1_24870 [soil metagenome]
MTRTYRGRPIAVLLRLLPLAGFTIPLAYASTAHADDIIDYTVKKGDTCAAIAQRQWGDSRRVDLIHGANPNMGPPPHDLKEGTVLHLPRTIPVAAAGGPDAKLTHFRNRVQTQTPEPAPAKQDAALNRGNRVTTEDQSAAQVTFRDETQIELGEKTLVVILGDMRANAARTQNSGDTTLVTGSLRSKLGQLSGTKPPVIATEGARVTLGRGATQVSVDDKKATRLAVYDGQSTLSAQKKDVVVPTNFGSKAELGKAPTPPKPLPGAPSWKTPLPTVALTTTAVAEVKGAYQRGTTGDAPAQYHVQIAHDGAFLDIVTDVDVPDTITELDAKNLSPGDYHVRVSAIDADRFEGPFGAASDLRVVSIATAPGAIWSQDMSFGSALTGLFCSLYGGPICAVAADGKVDRFHAHDLKCAKAADGVGASEIHLAAEPFDLTWTLDAPNALTHSGVLRAEAKDKAGHPVDHATLAIAKVEGIDVDVFATRAPGVYNAKVSWVPGVSTLAAKVAANGEAHGEIALALPGGGGQDVLPLLPKAAPKTSFGEAGIEAGFSGAANGIGPFVGFRAGVRQDVEKFELSVNAMFSMEARASDETGSLPLTLTGGSSVSSYTTSERVYIVSVPVEARYKLGKSPFSAGLGITPFIAFENANVGYFGGNVSLRSPNTVFGANLLGVVHLVAGPGSIVLAGGIRVSTIRERDVVAVDLLGPYVSLGYRLAM